MAGSSCQQRVCMHGREGGHSKCSQGCARRGPPCQSPGQLGMVCMAQHFWWPYMNRDLLVKAIECKFCTAIGKNLKSVIPAKQFQEHTPCIVPNQEIQIDFAGPIINEKEHEDYILTCMDGFSKYPSAETFENANASNVIKSLDNYIHAHGVPRSLRIDQARCLIGTQMKKK